MRKGGEDASSTEMQQARAFLSEIIGAKAYEGIRHPSMESIYEYGARAGVWRLMRIFEDRDVPLTVFCVGMASSVIRNPSWP